MNSAKQLFIPDKIKVGYQNRSDTYTQKLGYVIYYDKKGVLRKEKSWTSWCDKKLGSEEIENVPTEGFVLNRDVGGARRSYGWNARIEKVRVFDPRGFEFEISIPNLLFILKECDCSRGKGLEGNFVYSWEGTELVLLPVNSEEYKNSKNFTKLQGQSVKGKDLIPGASYTTNKQEVLTFLGRFDYFFMVTPEGWRFSKKDVKGVAKKYVFYDGKNFHLLNETKTIAALHSDAISPDLAELTKKWYKTGHGSRVEKLFLKSVKQDENTHHSNQWYFQDDNGDFIECSTHWKHDTVWNAEQNRYIRENHKIDYISVSQRYSLVDGVLTQKPYKQKSEDSRYQQIVMVHPDELARYKQQHTRSYGYSSSYEFTFVPWREPTSDRLFAQLESGAKVKVDYSLTKDH